MKQEKVEFKNSKGQKLVGILHIPDGEGKFPAVIFVHGYRSTKESRRAVDLSKRLAKLGFVFFRFDLLGRGESDGKFEDSTVTQYIDDLKCAIDFISDLDFVDSNKIGVGGHSLGGIITLNEVIKDKRIKCLVLQAPVSIFPPNKNNEFSDENAAKWKKQGWIYTHSARFGDMKINYKFYEDGLRYDDYSVYESIKIPALVIHGTKDKSVSIESVKELVKHLKKPKFIILEGADHEYTKPEDYERVMSETIRFLEAHLK